jgi:membrane protease YdiL (CAAX protease family)
LGNDRSIHAVPPGRAVLAVVAGVCGLFTGAVLAQLLRGAGLPVGLRSALILSQVLLALPAAVVLGRAGALRLDPIGPGPTVASAVAGFSLWLTGLGLLVVQQSIWPPAPGYLEAFRNLHAQLRPTDAFAAIASVAAIALAPALCEELVFRGLLLPSLVRLGRAAAVVLSSIAFGVLHVDFTGEGAVLYRIPFALLIGLGLGALRLRAGTLLAPALAHGILNTLTFAVVAAGVDTTGTAASPPVAAGPALLVIGGVFAALSVRAAGPRATLPT